MWLRFESFYVAYLYLSKKTNDIVYIPVSINEYISLTFINDYIFIESRKLILTLLSYPIFFFEYSKNVEFYISLFWIFIFEIEKILNCMWFYYTLRILQLKYQLKIWICLKVKTKIQKLSEIRYLSSTKINLQRTVL